MEENNKLTYTAAVEELEEIVKLMQSQDCSVDNLGTYTKRSAELLKFCKEKLTATESEVQNIIAQLDENTPE